MSAGEPESEHAKLARKSVESYVKGEGRADISDAPEELRGRKAGVFVCLKKEGELRGCIGTIQPAANNIAEEIRDNAVSSATSDFRFPPVGPDELASLTYSVDVLEEPEEWTSWIRRPTASSCARAARPACCCRTWKAWTRPRSRSVSPL